MAQNEGNIIMKHTGNPKSVCLIYNVHHMICHNHIFYFQFCVSERKMEKNTKLERHLAWITAPRHADVMKTVKYHVRRRARKISVPREHGPKGTVKYNLKITVRAPYRNVSQVTLFYMLGGGGGFYSPMVYMWPLERVARKHNAAILTVCLYISGYKKQSW